MSITVFQIPDQGGAGNKKIMVHDLDAAENASTKLQDVVAFITEVEIDYESQVDDDIFTEEAGTQLQIIGVLPVVGSVEIHVDGAFIHKGRNDRLSYTVQYFQNAIFITMTENPTNNQQLYSIKYKKQA